jgi:hypothetical protein
MRPIHTITAFLHFQSKQHYIPDRENFNMAHGHAQGHRRGPAGSGQLLRLLPDEGQDVDARDKRGHDD